MTVDLTVAPADVSSTCRRQVATYTGPALYATGGDPVTPASVRMGKLFAILGGIASNGTLTYVLVYNATTGKILWFDMAGAEVAASTVLTTFTARVEFVGQ